MCICKLTILPGTYPQITKSRRVISGIDINNTHKCKVIYQSDKVLAHRYLKLGRSVRNRHVSNDSCVAFASCCEASLEVLLIIQIKTDESLIYIICCLILKFYYGMIVYSIAEWKRCGRVSRQ